MIYHHEIKNKEEAIKLATCGEPISFDGVDKSVYKYWRYFIRRNDVYLFIIGDWVGKFGFCNWNEIMEMSYIGAILGYHSHTHAEPKDVDDIHSEICSPINTEHFALPYGRFTEEYLQEVKKYYKYIYGTNLPGEDIILRKEL